MFAKYPEKGKVKTRLCGKWHEGIVARLCRSFIEDLLDRLSCGDYDFRIAYHPVEKKIDFIKKFGNGFSYMAQIGTDWGERMNGAFTRVFLDEFQTVIIIGSDSPDLPREIIEEAFQSLEKNGAVMGPSRDGGYYLIGFRQKSFFPGAFKGIAWGTDHVFEKTMGLLQNAGISVHVLPLWLDVDTPEDVAALVRNNEKSDFSDSKTISFLKNHGMA